MKRAGLWMHVWDVWSDGLDVVCGYAHDAGLTHLYPAVAYHAGWFIHPHSRGRRVWMPEDGVVYFRPDPEIWADSRVQPVVSRLCAEEDWLARLGQSGERHGLGLSAWTVCCHNTRLGTDYPELTVENCFGDRYPHALNPSHPDVRAYLAALVRNLARCYPLHAVQLESPAYQGFRHGHHHERTSVVMDTVAQRLFDLSFAPTDLAMARAAGIDGARLRSVVAERLQEYFDLAPERPAWWPANWDEAEEQMPCLRRYLLAQNTIVEALRESCRSGLDGTATVLEGLGYGSQYATVTIGCYGLGAAQVASRVSEARRHLEPGQELQVGLRVGFGDVPSAAALAEIVAAVDEAGADGVLFYNYSEMSRANLTWIGPALEGRVSR
ncbi:MAG: ferric iron reductase [Armatimonadetes bacterium]|nr:ferric iron reductase [Armatimonadota bacterium]